MCGILFCTNYDQETVEEAFKLIDYRGPDNTTLAIKDDFWFCHHRLNIIEIGEDPGIGNQPIKKHECVLICNGEIYNYKELAEELKVDIEQTDCEIILDLYNEFGIKGFEKLDGDFAFVLYDPEKMIVVSGRDPIGLKPLFVGYEEVEDSNGGFYSKHEILAISSEAKVLESFGCEIIKRHPIGQFRIIDVNPDSDNCMKYTKKLHQIKFTPECIKEDPTITYKEAKENINELLTKSVEKRVTHTDKPYAFLCSGGIDSSLILSIGVEMLGIENVHVFTLEYEEDGRATTSLDSQYTDMLMETLGFEEGTNYTKVKFNKKQAFKVLKKIIKRTETYDPNTLRASIPMYFLAKHIATKTDFKVILSGEGADELFMGYNYFSMRTPTSEESRIESMRLVQNLHSFDVLRAERCFATHGLELRVPFLDFDLIKYVLSIPGHMRLPNNNVEKYLLRDSFRDLFTELNIPDRIFERQKERFSDGVSRDWVPTLINHVCEEKMNSDAKTTDEKAQTEKEWYRKVYDKNFTNDLIIPRVLPDWTKNTEDSSQMLLSK